MTNLSTSLNLPQPVEARRGTLHDEPALRRLWLIFRHDMSAYSRALPRPDGSYRSEWLELALTTPAWSAWLLTAGEHPIGFALTRAMDEPVRVLNSFFLVAPARRGGLGLAFARTVLAATPGPWAVAYQDANLPAARFWPAVAASFDDGWAERPPTTDQPRDVWVTFTVEPGGDS